MNPLLSENNNASPQSIADYLAQLLKDRKQLAALPNVFTHLERLLDEGKSNHKFIKNYAGSSPIKAIKKS
jgi:hypothetical protein